MAHTFSQEFFDSFVFSAILKVSRHPPWSQFVKLV